MAERFQELPRALRWLGYALALTALFLLWDSTVRPLAETWRSSADKMEANLARLHDSSRITEQLRRLGSTVIAVGPVERPGSENTGGIELSNVITQVLREHRVRNDNFNLGGGGPVDKKVTERLAKDAERVNRITGTLKFEASPADAIALIADLESQPEIESISRVHITKAGSGRVAVNLMVEAWVMGTATRTR